MKKVAITGGLSSGKSTVCKIFKDLGAYTVSSDEIVHNLLLHDRTIHQNILLLLGPEILSSNHIDRGKVAQIVFSDTKKLQALENLLHPAVFHEIQSLHKKVKEENKYALFIAEVPLLFETDHQSLFDTVVTVLSDQSKCRERFTNMTERKEADFDDRMMRQIPPQEKAARADFILMNNGTLADLKDQVTQLASQLRST